MNPIQGLSAPLNPLANGLGGAAGIGGANNLAGGKAAGPDFKQFLLESLGEVNQMQQQADVAVEQLVTGGEANMAEVLTAVQKADLSFRMMMQVRNKLMGAYQEIKDIRI